MRKPGKTAIFFLSLTMFLVLGLANTAFCGDLILNDLKSNPVNLSSLAGKPTILFFWTTWCPYCRSELRALNKAHPQMEKEGVAVFAVNVGETGYKVENFLKSYALNLRVLLDKNGLAAENYEIRGVPTYIFINKNGRVTATEHSMPANYIDILSQ